MNILSLSLYISVFVQIINCEKLLGVTLEVMPYVYIKNNTFYGYCIDLMDEISRIAGFDYSLYISPDKTYGIVNPTGRITGMIGEVFNRAADFAIADLTVTEDRKRYVEFTEPFMRLGLSALVHKSNVGSMQTMKDLSRQSLVKYGTYRSGQTLERFYESDDDIISKMYFKMMENRTYLVQSMEDGIKLVKNTRYALIQESLANEYIAANDCDLTVLHDYTDYFRREFSIAVSSQSLYLRRINNAIDLLKNNGTLDQLKQKHWKRFCPNSSDSFTFNYSVTTILCFINFLLSYKFTK